MKKQEYVMPTMKTVMLHPSHLLADSITGVKTTGLDGDDLGYDDKGGDQGSAW